MPISNPLTGVNITICDTEVVYGVAPDNTWTDLDISGLVGKDSLVLLKITNGEATAKSFMFRINGDTEPTLTYAGVNGLQIGAAGVAYVVCTTDPNGILEWSGGGAGINCVIDVVAYIA